MRRPLLLLAGLTIASCLTTNASALTCYQTNIGPAGAPTSLRICPTEWTGGTG